MPDYSIARFCDGDIGIYAESDEAAIRGWHESAKGLLTVFKDQHSAMSFVKRGEAEGYTFAGKNILAIARTSRRCRCSAVRHG